MADSPRLKPVLPPWPILALAGLVLFLSVLYIMGTARREQETLFAQYEAKSQFYAELIGERASSMLESAEQALLAIESEMRHHLDQKEELTTSTINRIRRQFLYLEQILNVQYISSRGELQFSVHSSPTPPLDINSLLTVHRDQWLDVHIEKCADRIIISRRIDDATGTFSGMLLAFIDPSMFFSRLNDYASSDIEQVGLWDAGGRLLVTFPQPDAGPTGDRPAAYIADLPVFKSFSDKEYLVGGFNTYQNDRTIASIYQLRSVPFFMGVAFSKEPLLKILRADLLKQLLLTVTALLVLTGMGLAVHRQLNRRRLAEKALLKNRSQQEIYQQVFEDSRAVKLLIDPDSGAIIDANATACGYYGYTREELLQMNFSAIASSREYEPGEVLRMLFSQETPCLELLNRSTPEAHRQVELYASPLTYQGRQLLYVIVHDITERRRMEADLVKARKMESAATLSGGIAHDFNNLLMAVIGFMELAEDDVPGDLQRAKSNLRKALKTADHARELTKKFLIIANTHYCKFEVTILQDVIEQAVAVVFHGKDATRCRIAEGSPIKVKIDRELILLTLSNLLTNAMEAMPEKGMVDINVSTVRVDRDLAGLSTAGLEPGSYAKIEIRDQGLGIAGEQMGKIFDPYYSSKERGKEKGMGLGLTLAYSVMGRHGGAIDIQSKLNAGTVCTLYLPLAETPDGLLPSTQQP